MEHFLNLRKLWPLIVSGVVYLGGQYFRGVWFINFPISPCLNGVDQHGTFCNSPYLDQGLALITAGEVLAVVGVILLFANEKGFSRWLKLSYFYVPIAAILTIWLFPFKLPPGVEIPLSSGVWDFGILYILITLGIVLYSRY